MYFNFLIIFFLLNSSIAFNSFLLTRFDVPDHIITYLAKN